jgi:hypothetical protein
MFIMYCFWGITPEYINEFPLMLVNICAMPCRWCGHFISSDFYFAFTIPTCRFYLTSIMKRLILDTILRMLFDEFSFFVAHLNWCDVLSIVMLGWIMGTIQYSQNILKLNLVRRCFVWLLFNFLETVFKVFRCI